MSPKRGVVGAPKNADEGLIPDLTNDEIPKYPMTKENRMTNV